MDSGDDTKLNDWSPGEVLGHLTLSPLTGEFAHQSCTMKISLTACEYYVCDSTVITEGYKSSTAEEHSVESR